MIVHVETTPAEREAATADLIRALNRLRERRQDSVVKEQKEPTTKGTI